MVLFCQDLNQFNNLELWKGHVWASNMLLGMYFVECVNFSIAQTQQLGPNYKS